MFSPLSFTADSTSGLQARDLKAALVGWGAYMVSLLTYCMLHQAVVSASIPDVVGSVIWIFQEWGVWLFVTPFLFRAFRRVENGPDRQLHSLLQAGVVALVAALAFRVVIDLWKQELGIASAVVIYLPRYLAALIGVALVWRFVLHKRSAADPTVHERVDDPHPAVRHPDTLLVSKGSSECLLPVDRIACINAAANYVEILSGGQTYLMRATMRQVEQLLPPSMFLRVHRSHIVNIGEIERIKTHRSGNGVVALRCGKTVSMSKNYRVRLSIVACKRPEHWVPPNRS